MATFAFPGTPSEASSSTETMDWDYYPAVPKRVSKPWLYETHFPLDQPPDINYRLSILTDQANLEGIIKNDHIPFQERYLRYEMQDKSLEGRIMKDQRDWVAAMLSDAQKCTNLEREKFFEDLLVVLVEDKKELEDEGVVAENNFWTQKRHRVARELGIPPNHEDWSDEDRSVYWGTWDPDEVEYNYKVVHGWPRVPPGWTAAATTTGSTRQHHMPALPRAAVEAETIMSCGDDVQPDEEEVSDDWDEGQPQRKRQRLDGGGFGPEGRENLNANADGLEWYRLRRVKSTCIQS